MRSLSLRSTLPYFHPTGIHCLLGVQESVKFGCSNNPHISVAETSKHLLLAHVTYGCGWTVAFVQAAGWLWAYSVCVIILEHRLEGAASIWDISWQWMWTLEAESTIQLDLKPWHDTTHITSAHRPLVEANHMTNPVGQRWVSGKRREWIFVSNDVIRPTLTWSSGLSLC